MSAPIFDFNDARPGLVDEVVRRVVDQSKDPLFVLNEAAYLESKRLSHSKGSELAEWQRLASSIGKMTSVECKDKLREYAEHYAWDVAGNFNPKVYKFASRAVAPLLGALLAPKAMLKSLPGSLSLSALDGRVSVEGPRELLQRLARKGTVVYVPTHLSNLDSVTFGFALERAGLPPATYGAGKNLFTNPVLSFFMHNLGAYRVDRRLRHTLYKDVLKAYSCLLIERGYHSLFFPGGTRSRSGGVERRLKLGLAGTGVEAFSRTATRGKPQPVYFVPATINYQLTLEAETLIDDFLQEEGKARYIIDDDESARFGRVAAFLNKTLGMDAACVVRFSAPLDCFGNHIGDDGESYDARGRRVDASTYVIGRDGKPTVDAERDAEYTRVLGEAVVRAYQRDTVVMVTHVVAAAAFEYLHEQVGSADLFAVLRHEGDVLMARDLLARRVAALVDKLKAFEADGKISLSRDVRAGTAETLIDEALKAFAGYHSRDVLVPRGDDLVLAHGPLIFYYQNRLAAHGLSRDHIAPKPGRG